MGVLDGCVALKRRPRPFVIPFLLAPNPFGRMVEQRGEVSQGGVVMAVGYPVQYLACCNWAHVPRHVHHLLVASCAVGWPFLRVD